MAPPLCGLAPRSLALLLLACTSCALLLALRRCSGGAPGGCPRPQLATVNGALQVTASRLQYSRNAVRGTSEQTTTLHASFPTSGG